MAISPTKLRCVFCAYSVDLALPSCSLQNTFQTLSDTLVFRVLACRTKHVAVPEHVAVTTVPDQGDMTIVPRRGAEGGGQGSGRRQDRMTCVRLSHMRAVLYMSIHHTHECSISRACMQHAHTYACVISQMTLKTDIYMRIYIYIYMYTYIYIYMFICTYMHIHVDVHMHARTYICT